MKASESVCLQLQVEVWAEQSLEERSAKAAAISRRNQFSFTTPDVGAVRRAYTEANMEAEIQGQKLTEVITKLKGDLKTVAEVRCCCDVWRMRHHTR